MNRPGLFAELKRRNVLRAAVLYAGAVWALAQGLAQLLPLFGSYTIPLDPGVAGPKINLASVLLVLGRPEQAMDLLRQSLAIDPLRPTLYIKFPTRSSCWVASTRPSRPPTRSSNCSLHGHR